MARRAGAVILVLVCFALAASHADEVPVLAQRMTSTTRRMLGFIDDDKPQIDKAALLQAGIQLIESKKGKKEELLQLTPPAGPPPEVLPELVVAPPPLLLSPPAIPPTEISGAVSGAAGSTEPCFREHSAFLDHNMMYMDASLC